MSELHMEYLNKIEELIEKGVYKDNWESLSEYPEPSWYKKAKFGLFIHWGVYSVPAFGNEWYPRKMYIQGTKEFDHHIQTYGNHKDFGYADFVPLFTAEKFNAEEWIELFKSSGAKYIMPVAEHHDGFQLYDSELSDWNSVKMGPKRDIIGELKTSAEKEGLIFTASSHRAENFWFFGGGRDFDSGIQELTFQEPYGYVNPMYATDNVSGTHNNCSEPPSLAHLEDWLVRSCELVDKYQPRIVYFDWWILNVAFKPYLKKFAAYYYNRSMEWGVEVAINYKYDAFAYDTAIFDIERGQLNSIRPKLWQTDTAIATNSWGYTENNNFKNPIDLVCNLIDIVSKNGCMLLNVGPKADGSITNEETEVLRSIGKWLATNGESIYGTTFWNVYGEGSTVIPEGSFTDIKRESFKSDDIRFTYKAPYIYANVLNWSDNKQVVIQSLKKGGPYFDGHIVSVELIGFSNTLTWERSKEGLIVTVNEKLKSKYPVCLKIQID